MPHPTVHSSAAVRGIPTAAAKAPWSGSPLVTPADEKKVTSPRVIVAAGLPEPVLPATVGVNIHFTDPRPGDIKHSRASIDKATRLLGYVPVVSFAEGLARTLARAGDVAASRKAYEQFFARWKNADADLPLLAEASAEHEALRR